MNDKLFIPQAVLDKWVESGKVVFNDQMLTLVNERKAYTLTSAVRFMSLLAGDDTAKLLGRLRSLEKLAEIGAEHMSDSVILGDTAYQVQEGFIAVLLADDEVATKETIDKPAPPAVTVSVPVTAAVVAAAPVPAKPAVTARETPTTLQAAPANTAVQTVEITATPGTESADAELLTKFLLNNLNF